MEMLSVHRESHCGSSRLLVLELCVHGGGVFTHMHRGATTPATVGTGGSPGGWEACS